MKNHSDTTQQHSSFQAVFEDVLIEKAILTVGNSFSFQLLLGNAFQLMGSMFSKALLKALGFEIFGFSATGIAFPGPYLVGSQYTVLVDVSQLVVNETAESLSYQLSIGRSSLRHLYSAELSSKTDYQLDVGKTLVCWAVVRSVDTDLMNLAIPSWSICLRVQAFERE
ncbi:hypothetical protein CLF_111955 [Clonorchis sinensis]|uniref:Uncharacterized protein n=1 Tax=Clonorchis sinensis TaxID=79923 RepID=G7YM54_CLOSI|nr:hypothetical protein CLF_111955 [Clonorchis sinensis]